MNKELTITPLLINHRPHPDPKSWVKLLIYEPTDNEVLAARGKMYAVLSLSSQTEVDFTPHMQLIIETLQQRYFGQTQGGIMQTLEVTIDAIEKQLILAGQQDKRLSAGFSFDILVTVSWGTVLYVGQLGSSRARLMRQGKLFNLEDPTKNSNHYLSSGVVQAGDRFFLATGQLLSKFNQKQLLNTLLLPNDTILPCIEQSVNQQSDSLESGLLLMVDIKQVPSLEEEGLRIKDADALSIGGLRNAAQNPALSVGRLWTFVSQKFTALRHWHIAGKIPGFPLAIIIVCIIGLIASVSYKYLRPTTSTQTDISTTVNSIQSQLDQANQLANVNPDRAQDVLDEIMPVLAQAQSGSSGQQFNQLAAQAQQLQKTLLKVQVISPHPIGSATSSQPKLTIYKQNLYLINDQHQLIQLAQDQLKKVPVDSQVINQHTQLAATTNGLIALQSDKATLLNADGQEIGTLNPNLGSIISTAGYQQNAYALTSEGQLKRLSTQIDSISTPSNYFATSQNQLIDVAIDGNVYGLSANGIVQKFTAGEPKPFALERDNLAKGARAIFASPADNNLYLLGDHQLMVWNKDGQYMGQYQLSQDTKWQAATVDVTNKTLYILSEGKLLQADLP